LRQADADLSGRLEYLHAEALQLSGDGVSFALRLQQQQVPVRAAVLGSFNAHNLLGVIGCLVAAGFSLDEAAHLAGGVQPVTGRMQRVGGAGKPLAVIDYAHTPDALEQVLSALRNSLAPAARLVVVFGCGGDRDRGKRPIMGAVAARLADRVIVTSDNPRTEAPEKIIEDVLEGAGTQVIVENDRAAAIALAIAQAGASDIVLIAGKGHEDYQEVAGQRLPFSDVAHARAAIDHWQVAGAQ
jgi:UDP-N-acetylmuramoyl-L-alanyl-D-glutamate--2,6-diaminopimelate ligase